MPAKYKNVPIVEALCEVHFISGWDMTTPGIFYEQIKNRFPQRKQTLGLEWNIEVQKGGQLKQVVRPQAKIQFLPEGKEKPVLIQLAPDILTVSHLKPYESWEAFKETINFIYKAYIKIASPQGIKRIGLRYINVFEFGAGLPSLSDYFAYFPHIPKNLSGKQERVTMAVVFPFKGGDERLLLNLVLKKTPPPATKPSSVILDLDYAAIKAEGISLEAVPSWLDNAHEEIERAFEASITDKTRAILEPLN